MCACRMEIEDAFIVICLICSSSRESKYLSYPASFCDIILLDAISVSDIVVLPWSTCAKMQIFRMRSGIYYSSFTFSIQDRPSFFVWCCPCSSPTWLELAWEEDVSFYSSVDYTVLIYAVVVSDVCWTCSTMAFNRLILSNFIQFQLQVLII